MIISRIKSPPYENPVEVLYQGEAVEFSDIPLRFNLGPNAREYYYAVYWIKKENERLFITAKGYDLSDFLSGNVQGNWHQPVSIPLNKNSKKGLLELFEELLK